MTRGPQATPTQPEVVECVAAQRLLEVGMPTGRGVSRAISPADWTVIGISLAVALVLRHAVVEPAAFGHACDPAPWAGLCAPRTLLTLAFRHMEIGWVAALVGTLALALARVGLPATATLVARIALALGLMGLVLYSYDPAVVGVLAGLIHLSGRRESAGT